MRGVSAKASSGCGQVETQGISYQYAREGGADAKGIAGAGQILKAAELEMRKRGRGRRGKGKEVRGFLGGDLEEPAAEEAEGEEEGDDAEGAFFAGRELEKHGGKVKGAG